MAVGLESEIALSPPGPGVSPEPPPPRHPPPQLPPSSDHRRTCEWLRRQTRGVGDKVHCDLLPQAGRPVTISNALTLSRAYSQLRRASCLFVLLSALKRTLTSS